MGVQREMPYKNKEDAHACQKRSREANPEREKEHKKRFKATHPDYFSNYYQKMKDGVIKTWENTPVEDITGKKYGMLTAVEFCYRKAPLGRTVWMFRCDCGRLKEMKSADVVAGKTRSCGCISFGREIRHKLEESSFYGMLNAYRGGAKHRGFSFELTVEEFRALTKGNCAYCGLGPVHNWAGLKNRPAYMCNGVDRVDNTKGYTKSNSVSCCKVCNHAKFTMSLEEFNDWLDRVVKFRTNPESPAIAGE
jgi:hypothetical protein